MTPQEIQAAIAQLQNQLMYTHGNLEAQNNINQRIAQLTMLYQQQTQPVQQQMYQQPMYQQQMQQPMYQQQVFQQPSQQQVFQQQLAQQQSNSVATSTVADNTRYGMRKNSYMDKYNVDKPVVQEVVLESKPKIPLDGYEIDLFLEIGLECEIIELGDFYKYQVVTTPLYIDTKEHNVTVSDKNISRVSALAYSNDDNIITTSNVSVYRNITDSSDILNIDVCTNLKDCINSIGLSSVYGELLDNISVYTTNKLLRYYVGRVLNPATNTSSIIDITDISDILELKANINQIKVIDSRNKMLDMFNYIYNFIKSITIKTVEDNLTTLIIKYDTLFISDHDEIRTCLIERDVSKAMLVTNESYRYLHNALTTMLKDGKYFKSTSMARIAYNSSYGGIAYVKVYAVPNNMFVIEKE